MLTQIEQAFKPVHTLFIPQRLWLTPGRVKTFRHRMKWSARRLASEIKSDKPSGCYSKNYITKIESGILPITETFRENFFAMQRRVRAAGLIRSRARRRVVSRFPLRMQCLEILARPIRCVRCRQWIVPATPNQKSHRQCAKNF